MEDKQKEKALLVSVYQGSSKDKALCMEHLQELAFLCDTYDVEPVQKIPCHARSLNASTFISKGKVEELQQIISHLDIDMIVFDDEIAPSQQRNLEAIFKIPVIDRTEVILGIFAERAQTKEAHIQVELAELKYQAPRLKRMWTHLSRQAATSGGGAYLKGAGEKQIEIDKRLLKKRLAQLEAEIESVRAHRKTQRLNRERSRIPTFAMIGYTNAGKSTLLNAMTEANVFVENKLFATLETITRRYFLSNNQEILLVDTVGFIRKLPHLLVAAFRSTLEEALEADILLHVIDASHHMALEQSEACFEVLKELGAEKKPIITLLNKIDAAENAADLQKLRFSHQNHVLISAKTKEGFDELNERLIEAVKSLRESVWLQIPQSEYKSVSLSLEHGNVLEKSYEDNDVLLHVELPKKYINLLSKFIKS